MTDATDRRAEGAGGKPLSKRQIQALIQYARAAYARQQELGTIEETLSFDDWRHAEVVWCVERTGFRDCRNEDYLPLKARFLELAGRDGDAAAALARQEMEPRTWALHKLQEACTEVADVMPYAKAYALGVLKRRGMDDENATPREIWKAMYTVRRRAEQLRRKTATKTAKGTG